jgi:hypothetical protein|eukprot:SAG25_NODE_518_length_7263_cov_5.751535_3_plen_160_part_00
MTNTRHAADLDASRAPWYEFGKPSLANPLQTLVHLQTPTGEHLPRRNCHGNLARRPLLLGHLCWVHFSLDDVQDGYIAAFFPILSSTGYHTIFLLEQPPHHIEHCGLSHSACLRQACILQLCQTNRQLVPRGANFTKWFAHADPMSLVCSQSLENDILE